MDNFEKQVRGGALDNRFSKKAKISLGTVTIALILLVGTLSYAFFITPGKEQKVVGGFNTATMALRFADNDNGVSAQLFVGETVTKKFTIENTGTVEASLSIDWVDLVNTYLNGSLTYRLTMSETENGEYTEVIPNSNIPVSSIPITQTMDSEISVPAGETYYYNLEITLNNLPDVDQTSDLNAVFYTYFGAGRLSKYRYYTLSVDPNGGTWGEFTSIQEYSLLNDETKEIPNPTRKGYTFGGWDLKGNGSTLQGNEFSMGIEDASITALWTANKYSVTIEGEEREVTFGDTVDLGEPSKEGYTFTGWETTGGIIEGNTLTITDDKDIIVTPTYTINNYKYIVYHSQMNTSGSGYTVVGAETDEGEAQYNSTVTPPVKSYTGFNSPSTKSLTIKAETVYPPVQNKVEYNYDRKQHTITIELNGGTITESIPNTILYGTTISLPIPTKTGYNFANWTTNVGSVNVNEFTLDSDSDSILTANFTPKSFSVTFNANGGLTTTASKTVTYDSTYGDLPIPMYEGYTFVGWFTAQTGGTQVTSSTQIALSDDITLFAHWVAQYSVDTLLAKANDNNITSYSNGNIGEMYTFTHNNLTSTVTLDGIKYTHAGTQVVAWPEEERTDYRYIGSNPNNWIKFNNEDWRIIGVFTVETSSGKKEQLTKIIRNESIGNIPWDMRTSSHRYGRNEWTMSSLYTLLNEKYYNTATGFSYTFTDYDGLTQTITISKGLSLSAREQIEDVKWYLGALSVYNKVGGIDYYNAERGESIYNGTDYSGDLVSRSKYTIEKVGLMYISDFMFTYGLGISDFCFSNGYECGRTGNGEKGWLFNKASQWAITPSARDPFKAHFVNSKGTAFTLEVASELSGVRPTVYLKSGTKIVSGTGTKTDPYMLG